MKNTYLKLQNAKLVLTIIVTILICACANKISNQKANAEGFKAIENELDSKFGDNAYYTDLTIIYDKSIGNMINLTVTDAPESLKMEQWNSAQGIWKQSSEIVLEVPQGTKAADFMFQLDDQINLTKLGELVEKSIEQLTNEKDIKNPALDMAFIKFPKNGDASKAEYSVKLEPEYGGTSFTFYYKISGELIKMDY